MITKHILICEDDDDCLTSLSFMLENDGYMVSKAPDGEAAVEIIFNANKGNIPIDLLITDLYMPKLSGLELIKHIRNSGFNLPVIVMTGYGNTEILKELIKIGCDDFLDKPFGPKELSKKVSEVLEKQKRKKETYEKVHAELLKKQSDLAREIDAYKRIFTNLKKEFDTAVITYNDLVSIKTEGYHVPIAYRNKALSRLGGDYADICNTPIGCDILIADVAGHDLAASYHTVLMKAFFDENCRTGKDGKSFFQLLNHALLDNGKNERMVTALFLRLDLKMMQGEVVSAGHPKMIRLSKKPCLTVPISSGGTILGLYKDVYFNKVKFNLKSGDRLFLYTDGIINTYYIEGPTGKKYTLYESGLDYLISKHSELPLDDHVEKIWNDIMLFCRYKPSDDMLLFGLEIPVSEKCC